MRKIKLFVATVVLCTIMFTGCSNDGTRGASSNGVIHSSEDDFSNSDSHQNPDLPIIPSKANPISKDNIKTIQTPIIWTDPLTGAKMEFTVQSVELGKTFLGNNLGKYEKECLDTMGVSIDEQGNILSDSTYIWLNLDAKALDQKCRWTPEQFPIVFINDDLTLVEGDDRGPYICYVNGMEDSAQTKDAFFVDFKPNETKQFLFGFCLSDELVNNTFGYYISDNSNTDEPGNHSFMIKLQDE